MGMERIIVAARTKKRGRQLASEFAIPSCSITTVPFDADAIGSSLENAALLVNATPIGMFPDTDRSPLPGGIALRANLLVFDLIYRPIRTSLIRQAESAGCRTIGGTEMLIHQGAAAFTLWTGQTMPVGPVRQALAQHLSRAGSNRLSSLE
jgi:shikimate dehydrogenase